MNSFCMFCVGRNGTLGEIEECDDKYCPFYPIRYCDLDKEEEIQVSNQALHDIGVRRKEE